MIQSLLLAALLAVQDPRPVKTVEERIKELSDRIAALDKKATDLTAENHQLRQQLTAREQMKESVAKATASFWMNTHAGKLSLAPEKAALIEGLWVTWTKEDFGKFSDEAAWKKREETLRKELTAEQAALVEKSVRAEIDKAMDLSVGSYARQARIAAEREPLFRKTVWSRLKQAEAGLIPQAHAGAGVSWSGLLTALESSLPDLKTLLTPEEHDRLSKLLLPRTPK